MTQGPLNSDPEGPRCPENLGGCVCGGGKPRIHHHTLLEADSQAWPTASSIASCRSLCDPTEGARLPFHQSNTWDLDLSKDEADQSGGRLSWFWPEERQQETQEQGPVMDTAGPGTSTLFQVW